MDILTKEGKKINYLSVDEIEKMHNVAINKEVIQFKTNFSNIEILDENHLALNKDGKFLDMDITSAAYLDILNISFFNTTMKAAFQKILKDKDKTTLMLNKLKNEVINNYGDKEIILFGDRNNKNVIKVMENRKNLEVISNLDFLKYAYSIINRYGFKITDFSVNHLGGISINTLLDNDNPFTIEGLNKNFGLPENEYFRRGLYFSSKIGDYKIIPSTTRIICSNQITLGQSNDIISFNNIKMMERSRIENQLEKLKRHNFVPKSFEKQVSRAFSTPASLNEFEKVTNLILSNTNLEEKDLDKYINYSEITDTFDIYQRKNEIILNKNMKSQIPIDKTVWELVNTLTYISANAPGSEINDTQRNKLNIKSGEFLKGDYQNGFFDLQLKFDSPFVKKWY